MEQGWGEVLNLALGIPVFGALLILILLKKVVPGWSLQQMQDQYDRRIAEKDAQYARELADKDAQIAAMRLGETETRREVRELRDQTYREVAPTLARANDGLRATQELLREIAIRSGRRDHE